jgi:hypothetical protein
MSEQTISIIVLIFGLTAYATAVIQMIQGVYQPSFFSREVWFLLGIISFAGVFLGEGSSASVALAATLLLGNTAVFAVSYKKGSRDFGSIEKISLVLLVVAVGAWAAFDSPYLGLIISLIAHFIGGIPTLWRVLKRPESEQAYHWYFFFVGCIISIIASNDKALTVILFPVYFALFDGLVILLANRKRFSSRFNAPRP